jgi:hypothetical protein
MPDLNGDIPLTGDPKVDAALQRIRGKFQDLEDAMVVQAHLEKRQSESIASHVKWLEEHERRMSRIDVVLSEMTDKVNFLIDREMHRESGRETS